MIHPLRLLLGFALVMLPLSSSFAEPKLFQFYPDCDYQVVDTIEVSSKFRFATASTRLESVEKIRRKLIQDIIMMAQENGADGAILTDKSIHLADEEIQNHTNKNRVTFKAELINNCYPGAALSQNATPFDEIGLTKRKINFNSNESTAVKHTFTLNTGLNRTAPKLTTHVINFTQGAFGLQLNSSYQQALALFGTPTGVFQIGVDRKIVSYGRDFWLTFWQDKLVNITNKNVWLSNELLSMLAFDQRFELQSWQILDNVTFGMPISKVEAILQIEANEQHSVHIRQGDQSILLQGEADTIAQNEKPDFALAFYSLSTSNYHIEKVDIEANQHTIDVLSQFIALKGKSLDLDVFKAQSIGQAWGYKDTSMMIMDNHIVLAINGQILNKVYLLDSAFSKQQLKSAVPWHIGRLKQGQALEEVESVLGNDVFSYSDMLEVSNDHYIQELFFIDYESSSILNSAELTVF